MRRVSATPGAAAQRPPVRCYSKPISPRVATGTSRGRVPAAAAAQASGSEAPTAPGRWDVGRQLQDGRPLHSVLRRANRQAQSLRAHTEFPQALSGLPRDEVGRPDLPLTLTCHEALPRIGWRTALVVRSTPASGRHGWSAKPRSCHGEHQPPEPRGCGDTHPPTHTHTTTHTPTPTPPPRRPALPPPPAGRSPLLPPLHRVRSSRRSTSESTT